MKLSFRPHHFLCTLGFQREGYSPKFVENYTQIVEALQQNEELLIEVVPNTDSICISCPHEEKGICAVEKKIQGLDVRHRHILNIKEGDVLSWREAKHLLKEKMTIGVFQQACDGCEWKSLGTCEEALRSLHTEP